jgi:hypothetical protein
MTRTPPAARPRRGVALGVMGVMLLAFFVLVFTMGRPSYRKQIDEFIHHPFDPHPIGIDKRHKETQREWAVWPSSGSVPTIFWLELLAGVAAPDRLYPADDWLSPP